ncbi:hypothetical protein NPIL_181871 [Nephila pilipes]|uniref:Uncharacterized protein n=1 Tax=Nephila pilipes TaxID=299642 RepID=A0A8X6PHK3_NEPPI|nr:hypothetical protein NPIL_181871 [Nephila pilipes]
MLVTVTRARGPGGFQRKRVAWRPFFWAHLERPSGAFCVEGIIPIFKRKKSVQGKKDSELSLRSWQKEIDFNGQDSVKNVIVHRFYYLHESPLVWVG